MTPEDALARIARAVGCPLPAGPEAIAAAVERLAANADARERVHRRTLDQLRAAERELDALRGAR
ncbi:MAG: hypothetical protein EBX36_05755 [Planctomycetia bacterium]|nr:hypothetical protein [Planctomycetia bacterium]